MKKAIKTIRCGLLAAAAMLLYVFAACASAYDPPFVLRDGFVRSAHAGYAEALAEQGNTVSLVRSTEELDAFCSRFPQGALEQDYDELPSFAESVADLGGEFFAENVLLVVCFPNESGSCRLLLEDLSGTDGGSLALIVRRVLPEAATDDVVGRFLLVGVTRDFLADRAVTLRVAGISD